MKLETLDNIVRSSIISNGLTIHWYFDFLHSSIRCLREINLNVLRNTKSVILTIDNNGNSSLPCDYVDYVRIGFMDGQYVRPMTTNNAINNIVNRDSNGIAIPYPTYEGDPVYGNVLSLDYGYYFWYYNSMSPYAYRSGGIYGYEGNTGNSFKILENQGRIQFDQTFKGSNAVLDYISDGFDTSECNCSTLVSIYAIDTIEKYNTWQYLKTDPRKIKMLPLAENDYYLALKRLGSRMNPITDEDIRNAFRKGYVSTPKSF